VGRFSWQSQTTGHPRVRGHIHSKASSRDTKGVRQRRRAKDPMMQFENERREIALEIPRFRYKETCRVRPDFKDLNRVLLTQKLDTHDLSFLKRETIARRERLGLKRQTSIYGNKKTK
jgi:hypothetical protein